MVLVLIPIMRSAMAPPDCIKRTLMSEEMNTEVGTLMIKALKRAAVRLELCMETQLEPV